MMEATSVFFFPVGAMELLILLSGGLGPLMGWPPGARDDALLRCPPKSVVLYLEWAERAEGKRHAPGMEGLMADPEIEECANAVEQAILTAIQREAGSRRSSAERALLQQLPKLGRILLTRPGCAYVSLTGAANSDEGRGKFHPQLLLRQVQAALVVSAGDQASELARSVSRVMAPIGADFGIHVDEHLDHVSFPLPSEMPPVVLHRHDDYLILAIGEGTLDSVIGALDGQSNGLSESVRFRDEMKRVLMERTGSIAWLDFKRLQNLSQLGRDLGVSQMAWFSQFLQLSGLDGLNHVASASGLVDGLFRTKSFVANSSHTNGLWALASGRSIKAEDLQLVPADADLVTAFSLDLRKILSEARRIATQISPQAVGQLEAGLTELNAVLGVDVEKELLPAFDDVVVLYNAPSNGGPFLAGAILALRVRDGDKARVAYARLADLVRRSLPPNHGSSSHVRRVELAERKFRRHTIYYLNTIGDDMPLAPAFCLTDTHLLAALHPQTLKAHLRTLNKKTSFAEKLGKEVAEPDGELLSVTFIDVPRLVRLVYAVVPFLGQLAASELQSEGIAIDSFAIPSARAVVPYLQPQTSSVTRTVDGLFFESTGTLPLSLATGFLPMTSFYSFQRARLRARAEQRVREEKDELRRRVEELRKSRQEQQQQEQRQRDKLKQQKSQSNQTPRQEYTTRNRAA